MRSGRSWIAGAMLACAILPTHTNARDREQPATETEKDKAGRAYLACQADKAGRLDDGYSDAMTIGRAIAVSCRPEMETLAAVLTKGAKRDRMRLMLIDRLASHAAQDASVMVLLERKRRAEAGTVQR